MPSDYMSRYSCKLEARIPKGFITELVKRSIDEGLTPKQIKEKYNLTFAQWKSAKRSINNELKKQ